MPKDDGQSGRRAVLRAGWKFRWLGQVGLQAITIRLEAIASRLEAIATGLEAIAIRLGSIPSRFYAIGICYFTAFFVGGFKMNSCFTYTAGRIEVQKDRSR